jgi:large-conductance mechanosensitive channel
MKWENWTNGLNQSETACNIQNRCQLQEPLWNPLAIPPQYLGWAFIIFMVISFIAILFAFYLIAIGYGGAFDKKSEEKKEPEPKSKGKRN